MSIGVDAIASQEDVPTVKLHEQRLRQLLDKAAQIKSDTAINPPLQKSDFEADILALNNGVPFTPQNEGESTPEPPYSLQLSLETAGRNIIYPLIKSLDIASPAFATVWNLLDIFQFCADLRQAEYGIASRRIEEMIDSQTIDGCRYICEYMESRRSRFFRVPKGKVFKETKGKEALIKKEQIVLLRACNELLRRLSRAEDAVFCGRIFIFLFQTYPLGDRSGINLRGGYHTDNVTTFDDVTERNVDADESMLEDETATDEVNENGISGEHADTKMEESQPVADTKKEDEKMVKPAQAVKEDSKDKQEDELSMDDLYTHFWSLQHIFSNPPKLFVQEEFDTFKRGLAMTLKQFKATTKIIQTHATPRTPAGAQSGMKRKRDGRSAVAFASNFNPKYLTSRDLFELELSDLTFQRHILVQALILIDFLLSLTVKSKKKISELKVQKAMDYDYTLKDEDTKWAQETRNAIAAYLQSDGDGKYYYRMADTVLSRDKNWVRWKMEECPPISKPPVPTSEQLSAVAAAKRTCTNRRIKANPMGAIDMSFISDTKNVNDLESLKDPTKGSIDGTERWVRDVENIDLDLEMATGEEESYLKEGKTTATWRALRVATRTRFNILDKVDEGAGLEVLKKSGPVPEAKAEEAVVDAEAKVEGDDSMAGEDVTGGPEINVEPPTEDAKAEGSSMDDVEQDAARNDPISDNEQMDANITEADAVVEEADAITEDNLADDKVDEDVDMRDEREQSADYSPRLEDDEGVEIGGVELADEQADGETRAEDASTVLQ